MEDLCVDIDGFLNFADFFFDGFVADIFVQSKIRDGQNPAVWTVRLSIWTTTCKARTDRRKSDQIVFDGAYGQPLAKPELTEGNPIRLYSMEEITGILSSVGMSVTESCADFNGKPSSDHDLQLLICAEKK